MADLHDNVRQERIKLQEEKHCITCTKNGQCVTCIFPGPIGSEMFCDMRKSLDLKETVDKYRIQNLIKDLTARAGRYLA